MSLTAIPVFYFWPAWFALAALTLVAFKAVVRGMSPLLALEDSIGQLPDKREQGYTFPELKRFLEMCPEANAREYRHALGTPDLCFAVLYGLTWSLLLVRWSGDTGYLLVLSLVPAFAAACDFAENLCLRHVCLAHSQDRNLVTQGGLIELASQFTKQKWASIRLGVALTVLTGIHALYHLPDVQSALNSRVL